MRGMHRFLQCLSAAVLAVGCATEQAHKEVQNVPLQATKIDSDSNRIARYSCKSCEIVITHATDLGRDEDAPQHGSAKIRTDLRGNYWVPNTYRPGTVAVYGPTGEFIAVIGKEGSGPGEIRYVDALARGTGSTMLISDNRNRRISTADSTFSITGSIRPEASIRDFAVAQAGNFVVNGSAGGPPQLYELAADGKVVRSLARAAELDKPITRDPASQSAAILHGDYVIASAPTSRRVFAGNAAAYEILEIGDSVSPFASGRIDWFQVPKNSLGRGPRLSDAILDTSGRLWLLFTLPGLHIEPDVFSGHDPSQFLSFDEMRRSGDSVIEVWDTNQSKLISGLRTDQVMEAFTDSGHVYALFETPDGDLRARVWKLDLRIK